MKEEKYAQEGLPPGLVSNKMCHNQAFMIAGDFEAMNMEDIVDHDDQHCASVGI